MLKNNSGKILAKTTTLIKTEQELSTNICDLWYNNLLGLSFAHWKQKVSTVLSNMLQRFLESEMSSLTVKLQRGKIKSFEWIAKQKLWLYPQQWKHGYLPPLSNIWNNFDKITDKLENVILVTLKCGSSNLELLEGAHAPNEAGNSSKQVHPAPATARVVFVSCLPTSVMLSWNAWVSQKLRERSDSQMSPQAQSFWEVRASRCHPQPLRLRQASFGLCSPNIHVLLLAEISQEIMLVRLRCYMKIHIFMCFR